MAAAAPRIELPALPLAGRMSRLGTEGAFDVLVRAQGLEAQGREIVHLEIGEPDFPTAPHIVEAAIQALRDGWTHYGPPAGLPVLRAAVAEYVASSRGIDVDPAEVVITPGAKPIMTFTIMALVERGEEVLYPNPGFPIYESAIHFVGGVAVPYGLIEDQDFDAHVEDILAKITPRSRLIVLNSPHNPTGGVMPEASVAALAEGITRKAADTGREIFVLSDEIYSRLIFEGYPVSISQYPGMKDRTIILDGFSKTYAMTGWRLGYGVMRSDLAKQIALLMTNTNSCTASFSQIAGVEALKGGQALVTQMLEEFRRRRSVIVEGLNRLPGFRCRMPHGAFYAFPNITGTGRNSRSLANALLTEAGVACLSGTAFGTWGEGYLRFSFANSIENIQKALDCIQAWTRKSQ